jgi:type IV secretion system protein VirB10
LSPPDDRQSARRQLEAERERKEYNSLFASNVALSLRKGSDDVSPIPAGPSPAGAYPYITAVPQLAQVAPVAPIPAHAPQAETGAGDRGEQRPQAKPDSALTGADGKSYRLPEGTLLETVLTNRLASSLAGPVNSMLTTDVYSRDGQHLLLPRGSRILGEVKPVANFGQQRLAVVFHRILMPDGYSISLDQFQGLNQIGETGLRDQVNHHYLEIFGISIAIGAVAGLSEAGTQFGFSESATDEYRQGFAASLSQSALRILDRFLNIPATFTIREGHRIRIYLASDLSLPAYDQHQVPTDF